jgi:hypothetical protein
VFSAFGIGFSDISHVHMAEIAPPGSAGAARARLLEQARRGMSIEGFDLDACVLEWSLLTALPDGLCRAPLPAGPLDPPVGSWLELRAIRPIVKSALGASGCSERQRAASQATRRGRESLPVYAFESLRPGDWGSGPCLVEEAYFTTRVPPQWRFNLSDNGDLFVRR